MSHGVSPVADFCLKGTAGKPGSLTFSGQAKREPKPGADGTPCTEVTVTPHGRGVMKLLEAKPAQFRGTPEPVGAPRRSASGVSDDGHVAGSVPLFAAVSFEGTFEDGKRHGWGVLSRTRYEGGTAWSIRTIKCNWLSDVPQLLSDPCTIITEMEESGSSRVKSIFCGLAMAVRDADVGREQARSRSGSTATGPYRPDTSMSTAAVGGYSSGLSWVLSTAFFPDALGELIDYTQSVRYCGEFQCGLRHGFGIVTSLSSHAVHYMGQFESDVRQGAGTSIDDDRQLVFDGMWADGAIAAAGGTMHLPLPAPQAIQGQKWTDATTVGTGFLVNVRSAHTGMWEPLLSPLDESLPQLIESLEKLGSDLAASADGSPSAAASPTRVSLRGDAAAAECAGDEWQREAAVALSRFEPLFDRVTRVRRELERVRLTACHALSLGVAKRALATFQRCLLFLFGSCGTRPILECGAGGSMDDPGTYATSWCRLTSRSFPGFECCHRVRGGTPVSPATIQRFVQTASSLVMSLRLRLMTCHGAAQGSAPVSQHASPARHGYAGSPGRPESTCARDGTPSRVALSEVADSETAGRPSGQTATHTGTAPLDRTCPTCAHCALSVWIERAIECPNGVDCGEALDVGGFAMLADAAAATLSGCPLQSTSSRLIATAWDVVAASCVPVALAVARPAFSRQTGQFEVAVRRLRLAALRSLRKEACSVPQPELRKLADTRVVCLTVPEALRNTARSIHEESDANRASLAQRVASLAFALCDATFHSGGGGGEGVIEIVASAMRSVAEGLLAPAFGGADIVADAHRADTTDVGPMFTYSSSPPLSRGAPSAATAGRASTGSPRASSSGGSSIKTAGGSAGFISSRIEAITRLVIFARAFAFTLLGEAATADSAEKLTISLIHTALFFAHDPAHPVDPVAWLHLLLRVTAAPASISMVMGNDVECAHDGYASFVDADARAEASPQVSRVDAAAVTIGPLPPFCSDTVAVVSFELSAVGAWSLHAFAAAVASMTDTSRGVTGRDPAGSAPYAAVVEDLEALFDDHLTVPANILGSGCATRRPADGDDGRAATDAATTFSSGRLPSEYVVPTAPRIRREMRSRAAIVRDFLEGGLTERVPGAEEGGRSIESEDRVLVAVMDWALAVVGEHSIAPTRPQTRVFSLRRPDDGAKSMFGDVQAGSDSDSEPARSPAAGMSPAPVGIPKEMDPTPSTPASVVDAAMRRCYGGAEAELRELRLKPLVRVLRHLGLDLVVVEQRGGSSPSRPSTHDDFGSPGLVNIDPHSALHLRIELAENRGADAPAPAADAVDAELVPARRGALRLAPILVERVLNRWRQLRHRVELSAPTE